MNAPSKIAAKLATEIGKPENATFIERQLLAKAYAANRAAIARARQEAVLALRAEGAAERYALAQKMVREAKGGRFDFDAYTSACRAIDADYARREIKSFGLRGRV